MSHKTNDTIAENLAEWNEEEKEMENDKLTPEDLPENLDKTFLVSQDLHEFAVIIARLSLRGVDKRIIADQIINNLNYGSVDQICSHLDAFLRSKQY